MCVAVGGDNVQDPWFPGGAFDPIDRMRFESLVARRAAGEAPGASLVAQLADLLYLGHAPAIKDELTAEENLQYATAIAGMPATAAAVRAALADAGLAGRESLPGRVLSQGQRRRVALARLALGGRALWVLDEPLAALDSESSDRLRGWLGAHLDAGGCAVVATHAPLAGQGLPPARVRTLELGGSR